MQYSFPWASIGERSYLVEISIDIPRAALRSAKGSATGSQLLGSPVQPRGNCGARSWDPRSSELTSLVRRCSDEARSFHASLPRPCRARPRAPRCGGRRADRAPAGKTQGVARGRGRLHHQCAREGVLPRARSDGRTRRFRRCLLAPARPRPPHRDQRVPGRALPSDRLCESKARRRSGHSRLEDRSGTHAHHPGRAPGSVQFPERGRNLSRRGVVL